MKNTKCIRKSRSYSCKFLFAFLFLTFTPISLSAQTTTSCQQNLDCPLSQACIQGSCQFANCIRANNGADCPHAGNACLSISCDWDGGGDLGDPICFEERIEGSACAFDRDCGAESRCNTKTCECEPITPPPVETPPVSLCAGVHCDDQDDCTTDSCDENSGLCRHLKIADCPAPTPPPETPPPPQDPSPRSEAIPAATAPNPCLSAFHAEGFDGDWANSLAAEGICSATLTGQSSRACSLVEGPAGSPWLMLLPLLSGIGLISVRRCRESRSR